MANVFKSGIEAIEWATQHQLLTETEAESVEKMMAKGFDLLMLDRELKQQIEDRMEDLKKQVVRSPYYRYLQGGPRPMSIYNTPDFKAKAAYEQMHVEAIELTHLLELASQNPKPGCAKRPPLPFQAAIRVIAMHANLLQHPVPSIVQTACEGDDDLRLCLYWANYLPPPGVNVNANYMVSALGKYEAGRLVSARLAEHAAAHYYRTLGSVVEDVSVGQIHGQDVRWKSFDLLIGDRPVDVKNARRSFSNQEHYVEHCVPHFKTIRGAEVTIVGVLSDYYKDVHDLVSNRSRCLILGEVSVTTINSLKKWATGRFNGVLDLQGMWKDEYQPGWAFEYPPAHYPRRDKVIELIPDLLSELYRQGIPPTIIPGWLLSLCPDRNLALSSASPGHETFILTELHALKEEAGLSRPTLFILVLGLILESILQEDDSDNIDTAIRRLLQVGKEPDFNPIGLEDPQNYVFGLIDCLAQVRKEVRRSKFEFTTFKLTHPSILRGKLRNGGWITLVAYCGGWRQSPLKVPCGNSPLVLGKHESCPSCGHLICDICGYCSPLCKLVESRQAKMAAIYGGQVLYGDEMWF